LEVLCIYYHWIPAKYMNKRNRNKRIIPALFIELSSVTSGNIGSAALGFLINLILIRRFSTAEFGLFSIALLVFNLGAMAADFGLNVSFVRFFSKLLKEKSGNPNDLIITTFLIKLITGVAVFLLLFFASPFLADTVFHKENLTPLLRWASAGVFGFSIWTFTLSFFQAQERFKLYSILKIAYDLLKLTGILIIIYTGLFSLTNAFATYIVLAFIGFVSGSIFIGVSAKVEKINFRESFRIITGFSKWVVISTFCFTLFSRLDLIMLGRLGTAEEIGYYSTALRLISVITIIIASVKQVLIPKVSRFTTDRELRNFVRKSLKYTLLFGLLIIPFIIVSRDIIIILFTDRYVHSIPIFQVLSFAFILSLIAEPLFLVAYSLNKPEHLAINDVFQLIINFLLNLFLIPVYGAVGAAYATLGSRMFMGIFITIYLLIMVKKVTPELKIKS